MHGGILPWKYICKNNTWLKKGQMKYFFVFNMLGHCVNRMCMQKHARFSSRECSWFEKFQFSGEPGNLTEILFQGWRKRDQSLSWCMGILVMERRHWWDMFAEACQGFGSPFSWRTHEIWSQGWATVRKPKRAFKDPCARSSQGLTPINLYRTKPYCTCL